MSEPFVVVENGLSFLVIKKTWRIEMKLKFVYAMLIIASFVMGVNVNNAEAESPISMESLAEEYVAPEITEIVETREVVQIIQTEIPQKTYRYISECPLSFETQQGIFDICEANNISFEFVMAVIMQESSFRPNALGDNCMSKGLMQIQERYHSETMKELGVTDLYNPLDNVKVGVAILSSYFEENCDVYYVLMKYNGGHTYANKMIKADKVSDYAREITERAMKYEEENGI